MIEIINTLNNTSPTRTIFYAIFFIILIYMIAQFIIAVVEVICKENDSKDSEES